jgi:bacterioferritin-associated ferredoxin
MIVCHCNCIKSAMIEQSARDMSGAGTGGAPTPEEVYNALGLQPCCRGCFPLASRVIAEAVGSAAQGGSACVTGAQIVVAAE